MKLLQECCAYNWNICYNSYEIWRKSLEILICCFFKSCCCLQQMINIKKIRGRASRSHYKPCVSQAGAISSYFAWVGSEMNINIFCSSKHWNVFPNAICVATMDEKHCDSAVRPLCKIAYGDHRWVIWLRCTDDTISSFCSFCYIKQLLSVCCQFKDVWVFFSTCCFFLQCWFFIFISHCFLLFFSLRLSHCPPSTCFPSRCVLMSWLHSCPARLIEADNETGWLYYGSNEICPHRLHSRARGAATPLILALHRLRTGSCAAES